MKKLAKVLFATSLFMSPVFVFSQDAASETAERPIDGGGQDIPVDGGLSILLAAGVSYGAKKIYDKQKKGGVATEI